MPITISLLNSLSGVAGAIAGMAVNDLMLVSIGGIVGASGLFLTQIMCKAMNRSLSDILLGKTSVEKKSPKEVVAEADDTIEKVGDKVVEEVQQTEDNRLIFKRDEGEVLRAAKSVIIVPGYGMALAQAQHLVRTLADKFEENGAEVKFAIHPVAGRCGYRRILAEADVPYDKLYEMDDVNKQFEETDVVIVIGANDVINPAARDEDTPIYGCQY